MPATAQALYFHLCLNADDDGVAEGYIVMRAAGCSENDFQLLAEKNFIRILNEDFVVYILEWSEHNKIRADRKVDSIYKDLLDQKSDEKQEEQPRKQPKNQFADKCQASDGQMTAECQTSDGQVATKCPHRLGKDSIGKDRVGKDRVVAATACARARESYENNINPVASAIELEKICDDCERYGEDIFIKAVERAVMRNSRSLGYIEGILKRWEKEGYDDGQAGSRAGAAKQKALPPGYDAGCAALFEQACAEAVGSG
ncbi:MAG: DnaD domain protein [Bacteroidales bacterium]|nr:DnaD domain protein [Bacteroidales bacterium]